MTSPRRCRPPLLRSAPPAAALVAALLVSILVGCKSHDWVSVREVPRNPLAGQLRLWSKSGPKPTDRTQQYLRNADLEDAASAEPREMLVQLQKRVAEEPTAQGMYAISELSYIAGVKADDKGDEALALDMYAASVAHAYMYLLDERFDGTRNPYDPEYRRACDLYNQALEGTLRIVAKRGDLKPGFAHTIDTGKHKFDVQIVARGRWKTEEFAKFLFASDYDVSGLRNHYQTYGLGVPLIAVRKMAATESPNERFYPPGVSFPITAFLRVHNHGADEDEADGCTKTVKHCVLELHDPCQSTDILANDRRVPLESDLSMPLAYFLNQPIFKEKNIANLGFLDPMAGREIQGLYMLEPYDKDKIPVLFVHGLWSSPVTWTDMYNDLRSSPELGQNYQFWFYFYPTGQPFWVSATQLRMDLAEALVTLDPEHEAPKLDQMVLVGHSMGGLVSRLQTLDSRDDYWHLISDHPADELEGSEDNRAAILSTLYFKPNPSIRRVVTIGTPHRGSDFANPVTSLGTRLIAKLPNMLINTKQQLLRDNPDYFTNKQYFHIETGVDSLAPSAPFFAAMEKSPRAAWVTYHNIVGVLKEDELLRRVAGVGDGVVPLSSARVDDAVSEVVVNADHVSLHSQPKSVREVQRILREHLKEVQSHEQFMMASYHGDSAASTMPRREYRLEDHYGPNAGKFLQPVQTVPNLDDGYREALAPAENELGQVRPVSSERPAPAAPVQSASPSLLDEYGAPPSPFPDVVPATRFAPVD